MANINISINTVRQALTDLMTDGIIDQAGYDTILWYYNHCKSNNWSQKQASKEIDKSSWSTLYRVWTGKYGAGYDVIISDINKVKSLHEQRAKLASVDYIETSIYNTVSDVCTNALIGQEISTINGATQIGKSAAIRHFIKMNPDKRIIYLELPSCPSKSLFFSALGSACFVTHDSNTNQLRKYIKDAIDSKTLMILDEFHQVFLGSDQASIAMVEFVREVYNHSHCGVVLCGTDVLSDKLTRNHKHQKIFDQTLKRGLIHAQLPDQTPAADIKLAISKYGFSADVTLQAGKLLKEINEAHGFGVILKSLKTGATLSKKRGVDPSWNNFIEAWIILQRLSRKNKEEQ